MLNNKKPTIAIYSGEIPSTSFIERLIKSLADKNYHIYIFGIKKRKVSYSNPIQTIGYYNNRFSKLFLLLKYSFLLFLFKNKDKRKLDILLKNENKLTLYNRVKYYPILWYKPNIFHVQWAKSLRHWMWVQNFGIKLILSLRGAHINYSPIANYSLAKTYRINFPKVDGFHAVSKDIAVEAQKYGADKNKIRVVYSGLDIIPLKKTITKVKNDKISILSVGRNHWKKGYHYALDACKLLIENNINFNYTIIGANNDIELVYQVKDLGLESQVTLLNNMSFDDVVNYMRQTDILLLPSVEEGIANVVLEAMALGKIVLSSNCGGMSEVIVHQENGFLFPMRNVNEIANTIMLISALSIEKKESISRKAIETINNKHRISHMSSAMIDLYNHVLQINE